MTNFYHLRKLCAACSKISASPSCKEMQTCRSCEIYRILNTPCMFCGRLRGLQDFVVSTSRGPVAGFACKGCVAKFT